MIQCNHLSNGIRVVTERMPHCKTAAFGVWVLVGSAYETKENNGISHVIEHMLFQGTKTHSAKQLASLSAAIGDNVNAFTGKECTAYYGVTLSGYLPKLIALLGEMLTESVLEPDALKKEIGVILEEIDMYNDSPEDLVHELLQQNVWKEHPLGFFISGEKDVVSGFRRDEILAFMQTYYIAENMVLSVAGEFDEETVLALLENAFGGIKRKCAVANNVLFSNAPKENKILRAKEALTRISLQDSPYHKEYADHRAIPEKNRFSGTKDALETAPLPRTVTCIPRYKPCFCMRTKDVEQLHMNLAFPGIRSDSPKTYVQGILNSVLGGSNHSRLFQVIREELGLAYSVYSYASSYQKAGLFQIDVTLNPSAAELAFERILQEIERLKKEPPGEEELTVHRSQFRAELIMGLETPKSRMEHNAKSLLVKGKIETPEDILQGIDAVSADDLCRFAAQYLSQDSLSLCLIGPIGKRAGVKWERKIGKEKIEIKNQTTGGAFL